MGIDAIKAVRNVEATGVKQFEDFLKCRIVDRSISISDTISQNKLKTFKLCNTKGQGKSNNVSKDLKIHLRLFGQMYIATQVRGGDMDEFFRHETLKYPPSLTKDGEMRSGDKADLLPSLRDLKGSNVLDLNGDAACLEGSVVVNMTPPTKNQTFKDYCKDSFQTGIAKYREETTVIDLTLYLIRIN